ncbi:MAG: D-glycero-beta-D-manno-heptose-7-phosphate kinase [Parachlamydiales bacterium]|nr:D-glycero-beta-D-manno-heptose-7-phosphate kinase [Parachlamydiales bacterium]
MVNLAGSFCQLSSKRVLVVGDYMLDTYTIGKVRRISPEAPVSVLQVEKEENRPGGSGNVILNLISMGAEVKALGRIGNDKAGSILKETFAQEGVNISSLFVDNDFQTPLKNRIIAENQQIVRVDFEKIEPLSEVLEQQIIESLSSILEDIDIVAISDYAKGFCSRTLLEAIITNCIKRNIPVIVDPKGNDFSKYEGATIIKPNYSEAVIASGLDANASIDKVAQQLIKITKSALFITRSEKGITIFNQNGQSENYPVHVKEVRDVVGAGDTVLATLTCAIASGLTLTESAKLANVAAGIAIEHLGCARVSLSDMARRLLETDSVYKVFDEEHIFALQAALKNRRVVILGVSQKGGSLTPTLFKALRKLSSNSETDLIIYMKDSTDVEFVSLLASLHEVDFIVLKSQSLQSLCEQIHPNEVYIFDEDQLCSLEHTEALLLT